MFLALQGPVNSKVQLDLTLGLLSILEYESVGVRSLFLFFFHSLSFSPPPLSLTLSCPSVFLNPPPQSSFFLPLS